MSLRRRLIKTLLVLGFTLGTIAMTAKPADAAAAVWSCHAQVGTNFFLNGITMKLMAWRNGSIIEVTRNVTDGQGCAFFYVPAQYQGDYLYTVTNSMDVGHFYGSYYNGSSYASYGWSVTSNRWYPYNYGGWAYPGPDIWILQGTVSCQTCRWT